MAPSASSMRFEVGDAAHAQVEVQGAQALELASAICASSTRPTVPGPIKPDRQRVRRQIERRVHGAQRLGGDLPSTTTEMLRSEAPCAMARTLIAASPSELNTLAATPCAPAMPSPTTARIAEARAHVDVLNLAVAQLRIERPAHRLLGARRLGRREWRSRSSARSCPARSG